MGVKKSEIVSFQIDSENDSVKQINERTFLFIK